MVAVLALGQEFGHERLLTAIAATVALGACDVAAVRYLLTEASLGKAKPEPIDVGALARYDRPLPDLADYDTLLSVPARGPHDGRASGPGHPSALQDAADADDRPQFARLADAASREGPIHIGYLEALLAAEMEERESRAITACCTRRGCRG